MVDSLPLTACLDVDGKINLGKKVDGQGKKWEIKTEQS